MHEHPDIIEIAYQLAILGHTCRICSQTVAVTLSPEEYASVTASSDSWDITSKLRQFV
jgi:hypothetical protein